MIPLRQRLTSTLRERWRALGRPDGGGERSKPSAVIPWSAGYWDARNRFLQTAYDDPLITEAFRSGTALPAGYGVGFDERCIEYPWLLAQLSQEHRMMLDVGSALNHEHLLTHPSLKERKISILTLAPERECFWRLGVSYLFHDLRDMPLRDASFDAVSCISTLEHVGFDNTFYKAPAQEIRSANDYRIAMREICRVLKSGGSLFLTVPFGRHRQFAEFQQFDRRLLTSAVEAFGEARDVAETFYRYTREGWQISEPDACHDAEYVSWITGPRERWPDPLPIESDRASAARAVACVRITRV